MSTTTTSPRRTLSFSDLSQVRTDLEQITSRPHTTVGGWTAAQIIEHLAKTFTVSVDGINFKMGFFIRRIGPFFKNRFINQPMKTGFKMPEMMKPDFMPRAEISLEEALKNYRAAYERFVSATEVQPHGFIGKLTKEEWTKVHLKHSEMHLSFIVPA